MRRLEHNHLTSIIDSFQRGNDYFFLFPWADGGNLQDAWSSPIWETRPTEEVTRWALQQMEGIASAIKRLHSPAGPQKSDPLSKIPLPTETGCHGDLKPNNILLFTDTTTDSYGTLRISDAGLVKFYQQVTTKRQAGSSMKYGTADYAPPEFARAAQGAKRSRKFDVWSLGCLFLEFTCWILGRYPAVQTFRDSRVSGEPPFIGASPFYQYDSKTKQYHVHPRVVERISSYLENCGKPEPEYGTWLRDLVSIIKGKLLVVDATKRADSGELHEELQTILGKAEDPDYLSGPDLINPMRGSISSAAF